MRELRTKDLGLLSYDDCWRLQLELIEARAEDKIPDTLLFVQHPQVITLGRKSPGVREGQEFPDSIQGVPLRLIERGGEATYHGPGQLVVYPILRLNIKFGPKAFLRLMEESMIDLLRSYGVKGSWQEGKTGVWVQDSQNRERKIASLGIAVRRNVSYHGLAINVSNDLRPFSLIQPCGFASAVMTNLSELLGKEISVSEVAPRLEHALRARLSLSLGAPAAAVGL
ncbi:MAG TPA: lipoyl(octanoyl) transferase LipB [Bdellovibrionota bacterium]|jgi:lipoyl(octanoyl) transferase